MAKVPQTLANYTRLDPLFHFFAAPIFGVSAIAALVHFLWHRNLHAGALFLIASAAVVALFKIRLYALKVQDRVIRLEERLRLSALLPEAFRSRISELTESQLVALRFASDAEVSALAQRAVTNNLSAKEIKQAIQNWRPDYFRV